MTAEFSFFQIFMHSYTTCTATLVLPTSCYLNLPSFGCCLAIKVRLKVRPKCVFMKIFLKNCIVWVFFMHRAKFCLKFEQKDFGRPKHKVMMVFETKILKHLCKTRTTENTIRTALLLDAGKLSLKHNWLRLYHIRQNISVLASFKLTPKLCWSKIGCVP